MLDPWDDYVVIPGVKHFIKKTSRSSAPKIVRTTLLGAADADKSVWS